MKSLGAEWACWAAKERSMRDACHFEEALDIMEACAYQAPTCLKASVPGALPVRTLLHAHLSQSGPCYMHTTSVRSL
eukprot:1158208-Pelagomonas_calceolata.AAC.25